MSDPASTGSGTGSEDHNEDPTPADLPVEDAEPGAAPSAEPQVPGHEVLTRLEEILEMRVVCYFAGQATMERSDVRPLFSLLEQMGPQERAALVLQSGGGDADAAHHLAELLHEYVDELHVYVPTYAASAATLFCLGADVLWMGPVSNLSPIDPQVPVDARLLIPTAEETDLDLVGEGTVHIPAHVIRDFLELTGVIHTESSDRPRVDATRLESLLKPLNPWILGWYERATKVSRIYAEEALVHGLLKDDDERHAKAKSIVHRLLHQYASHNASILRTEARRMGIPVRDCPKDVWQALDEATSFYDQPLRGGDVGRVLETLDGFHATPLRRQRVCGNCGEASVADTSFRFCPHCGDAFVRTCDQCGGPTSPDWKFCPRCGEPNNLTS